MGHGGGVTTQARVLSVIVAVLLVAGLVTAVARDGDDVATVAPSTTSTLVPAPVDESTTTTAASPSEFDQAVADLEAFVAEARGLPFKREVKVTLLDDAAFRARLKEESDVDREELAKTTKILRALDLIEEDVDLEAAHAALLGAAVLGYYDYEKDELVVRGAGLTPGVRQTLVHELTHALQDQHFELDRPELDDRDDEASSAFSGLVEGDARRIEGEYRETLSRAEQREAERQTSSAQIDPDVPRVLLESLAFPYIFGPDFVDEVMEDGGEGRLNEAFATPPTTSEHILHPEKYLRGEAPKTVAEPAADGEVFDRGVVGEFWLALILGDDVSGADLRRAINGWGGDRYVAWDAEGRSCVRATFDMDTQRDNDELRTVLRKWADKHDGATVTGAATAPVTLTSCR